MITLNEILKTEEEQTTIPPEIKKRLLNQLRLRHQLRLLNQLRLRHQPKLLLHLIHTTTLLALPRKLLVARPEKKHILVVVEIPILNPQKKLNISIVIGQLQKLLLVAQMEHRLRTVQFVAQKLQVKLLQQTEHITTTGIEMIQ